MDNDMLAASPLRPLAIRLACIHAEDRNWIMQQLDDAQRRQMALLLEEIAELGLARDPSVLSLVMAQQDKLLPATENNLALGSLSAAPPLCWQAMLLQMQPESQRMASIADQPAQAKELNYWNDLLSSYSMPPALITCLQEHLFPGDSHHE